MTHVQLPFLDPTVKDVRVPATEPAAVRPGQKIDSARTRGQPSDRTVKPFSGPSGAERLSVDGSRFCAAQGHLKDRTKSEPSEQPSRCHISILDHRSKLRESNGASIGQKAGQELASKTLPPPGDSDTKTTYPTFTATQIVEPAERDPTFPLDPRPESSLTNPLINVL